MVVVVVPHLLHHIPERQVAVDGWTIPCLHFKRVGRRRQLPRRRVLDLVGLVVLVEETLSLEPSRALAAGRCAVRN